MSSPDPSPQTGETRNVAGGISIDLGYMKSIPGILTGAITIVSLIAFICVYAGRQSVICEYYNGAAFNFFGFVSMTAFLTGLFSYILFVFALHQKLHIVPWVLVTLIWCGLWAVLYLIASAVTAAKACSQSAVIAGAIFGFLVMLLLGARGFFAFLEFRAQRNPPPSDPTSGAPPEYKQGSDFQQY